MIFYQLWLSAFSAHQKLFNIKTAYLVMPKECVICREHIEEEYGKLKGSILRVNDENNKSQCIYVCSGCQKDANWVEKAKIKGV